MRATTSERGTRGATDAGPDAGGAGVGAGSGVAIATGSRHSLAIRGDGSLWAWGEGFDIDPAKIMDQVSAVAAGDTATIVRTTDGALWQWDAGHARRRLELRP